MGAMRASAHQIHRVIVCAILACYAAARTLQVITGPTPSLWLVALDVLSAAALAIVHGARHYGWRGILVFTGICVAFGNAVENLGVTTGIPFGHYRFLDVMGPRIYRVPVLLGLAYVGMAYASWTIARILVPSRSSPFSGARIIRIALVAACVMTAWDVAQDPVWSTFLHAWEWRDSGPWFGVPFSNDAGWLSTTFTIYLLFGLWLKRQRSEPGAVSGSMWPAVAFYAICAGGNVLQFFVRRPVTITYDALGRAWPVTSILAASALVSIFGMGSFAAVAAWRLSRLSTS